MSTELDPTTIPDRRSSRDDVLVDTAWLEAHLDEPGVCVVEVDVSPAAFNEGHIDGAVLWNIYADLKDGDYEPVDQASVGQLLSRSGIRPDSTVVLYGYGPALGFWLLKLYAHRDVRILDASRETWQDEHRPWTDRIAASAPAEYVLGDPDETLRATRSEVERAIEDPHTTLVDVRTGLEFQGERFWPSGGLDEGGRAGHIPGAQHLQADDLRDERGAFLASGELAATYAAIDLSSDQELISYCTIGGRAATTWFVLTYLLGYEHVRVYDGSWAQWGRTPDAPVAVGPG
jgi:thiosulfate/3-mercaptopyruvate sulfurtransferase